MAQSEAQRSDGIQAVSIVTPNHVHADAAIAFLEAGIHVICDKPLTISSKEAGRIKTAVEASKARFFMTHNHKGYPLIREARHRVKAGQLGEIGLVKAEYAQAWLADCRMGNTENDALPDIQDGLQ